MTASERPPSAGTNPNNRADEESIFLPVGFVDVSATLDGGQAFRWWLEPDGTGDYRGVVGRRVVRIGESDGGLVVTPVDGKDAFGLSHAVTDYLGPYQDLDGFRTKFADDPCLGPSLRGYSGLRILRQDPWECLFSFICSSTSNIPRIKLNVGSVAQRLGFSIGPGDRDVTFPEPEMIAESGEQFLRDMGLGFRAKYLVPAAEAVASGNLPLADLREASYADARAALVELHGVGEKVADCVLAFSLDKPESFIVDRHILRALHKWYGVPEKASLTYAADWARDYFGDYSALANQYMFHRERLARRAADWGGSHRDRALPEDSQVGRYD
ncbi:MAG: DNA glycosylase [Chloroflexi bacterium]|nr:DNA glycosylase [Chloroflexota bacterium]